MRSEQILVVDDEKRIVENISFCLKREGFQTVGGYDGDQAIRIFEQQKFDLVLLDVNMPGKSGYDVMEHILGIDEDVLIIIISGYASIESAVKALKLGAWDYLKKPFEYADLIKTVTNALAQKKLINDKKAICARLEASEKQYEYMVNNSPDLIFTLDQDGCFTFVNHQFEKLLDFSSEDLIGTRFKDILHNGDISKAADLIRFEKYEQQVNGGQFMHFRFKKAKTGNLRSDPYESFAFMELKATPMHLPAGHGRDEFNGVYAVARDVTERISLEDQLRQAQKMEAIGTLAGGIAHDFNNILMGIQGYASLVRSGFDCDSEEYKRLANIDEYVFNGAEMARQLLGFSMKTYQETGPVNLNYLLKMSAKMFGRTKKDIEINQYLEKDLWSTIVDEGQIKQVLLNLFVNAWQAMPDGGKIIIKSENIVMDDCGFENFAKYVKVTVSDTGVGMDDEIIPRIFDPFFTTKNRGQGTGLGLATAYGIIKSHKGIFKVESKSGKGSSFMFFLPAEKTKADTCKDPEENKIIFSGKGSILLVDDEKGVVEVCSEMLESLGYQVNAVSSGSEAIEILKTGNLKIDLIILDMIMPQMNGRETFEKIREIDPEIKVLISSGYSRESEIEKMMRHSCDRFIFKPFDITTLSEKLNEVFSIPVKSL
ncbi:hybrid sensor histidine kinase/response regulator [Desulfobacula phenolica]|uniref:histidine kinase n=1 Tax=Desulfobacula phenolica TaxID=90732 RepID=A0A1H2DMD8_9BACT|nr:response regulator [Desulfobacula phenolica]SDT84062.1 PAS domain S-box-containing protein [Desulfobacula phenolica]